MSHPHSLRPEYQPAASSHPVMGCARLPLRAATRASATSPASSFCRAWQEHRLGRLVRNVPLANPSARPNNPANPAQRLAMTTPESMLPETRLQRFLEDNRFQHAILVLIVANAAILGLETSASVMAAFGPTLRFADQALLAVFVIEIVLRIYAWRGAFFRDPWSLFDFTVVAIALLPATGPFSVLRALRVLRVLRILTIVPSMRRVVGALLGVMPGLGSTGWCLD